MRIGVHAGHNPDGKVACGAIGIIKESTENRNVKKEVIRLLKAEGHTVFDCTVDNGTSVSDIVNKQVAKSNAQNLDLTVSIHFNSGVNDKNGNGVTTGVEVLIYSDKVKTQATRICERVAKLGYRNRGVKKRTDLGFLKRTVAPALLVECCFVDDKDDINKYSAKTMAKAIVEGILNKTIQTVVPQPTPVTGELFYRAVSGSFGDKNNALNRKSQLEKSGFTGVFLDAFVKDEKTMYRVVCGSFKTKTLAEQRVKDMASKGFKDGFVTAFRK